ncbi:hypothetical protein CHS0354_042587 [Potamilus streckersoni]|uniref:Nucleoside diphosphate kinase n=1 Tax=Potamilus streckersoni TaxID=2493646 RepID=A0AAE0WCS7_9BIVA|nr:hypothetical protein CHS0354_042587 [Potamilus streckersoni]
MSTLKPLQLTLAILKPDIVAQPHIVRQIKNVILRHGFYFVRSKLLTLTRAKAEEFYKEHDGKFFHNRLVSFMSSGPISVHILARENAIAEWRKLMGPTKVLRTIYENPECIRGQFGLTDTRNSTHGSDSPEKAKCEINFFFSEFDIQVWEINEAPLFSNRKVEFDPVKGVHIFVDPK